MSVAVNYDLLVLLSRLKSAKLLLGATTYEEAAYSRAIGWVTKAPRLTRANLVATLEKYADGAPGKSIRAKIAEYLATGKIAELAEVERSPRFLVAKRFAGVLGAGPATLRGWLAAGYTSPEEVIVAARGGHISLTKLQAAGLRYRRDLALRIPRLEVETISARVAHAVRMYWQSALRGPSAHIPRIFVAGSYRRGAAFSGDIDIILEVPARISAAQYLLSVAELLAPVEILSAGKTKAMLLVLGDKHVRQLDLLASTTREIPTMLAYFTGSAGHNELLRGLAKRRGMLLNQYGLYRGARRVPTPDEPSIYAALGLDYVSPRDRS